MGLARFNKLKKTVKDGIDTKAYEFKNLKDFVGQTITLDGFFFTKGKFGKEVVLVGNGFNINVPKRYVEEFEEIAKNAEDLESILTGHVQLVDIIELDTDNGKTVVFAYKDI